MPRIFAFPAWSPRSGRSRWFALAGWLVCSAAIQPALAQIDIATLRARADRGDAAAANTLGTAYVNGLGVSQDFGAAVHYFRAGAEAGYAEAAFNLGQMYELGRGVPPDPAAAFAYYLQAAKQAIPLAEFNVATQYATGLGVPQNETEAMRWLRQAADAGLPQAEFNLGLDYEEGRGAVKNDASAQYYYRAAASQGHVRAAYNLALMLEHGRGSPSDPAAAAELYRRAASLGFGPAENNYGLMLADGRGVGGPNPVEAYAWLSLAVENGMPPAARDYVARQMDPGQVAAAGARLAVLRQQTPTATAAGAGNAQSAAVDAGLREQIETLRRELATARSERAEAERHAAALGAQLQTVQAVRETSEKQETRIRQLEAMNALLRDQSHAATGRIAQLDQQLRAAAALLQKQGESSPAPPPTK